MAIPAQRMLHNFFKKTTMKMGKGFAAMSEEQRKKIASAGGKAAHAKGKAHKFNSLSAREAGKKGGSAISKNKEYMAEIGRKGGLSRSQNAGTTKYQDMIDNYNQSQNDAG